MIRIRTIRELEKWMKANCYNDNYAIGNKSVYEGFGLYRQGDSYIWYYTERGQRQNLNIFNTEEEAVEFAFKHISSDKFANAHLVGLIENELVLNELICELEKRKIAYSKDQIPYKQNSLYTRVFVFGCDINKVTDLQEKYQK